MKYTIGIDLGTSSLKAILIDSRGNCLFSSAYSYSTYSPQISYSEQDPDDWYISITNAINNLFIQSGVNKLDIEGLGFSGQMHGLVCLDSYGNPLRNAIIWSDQRSGLQVQRILTQLGTEKLSDLIGNPLSTGFFFPSWLWIRENELNTAMNTKYLLLPKDYLRYRLTGYMCSDPSDAASTGLFDITHKVWSSILIDQFGINPTLLPEIRDSHQSAGYVKKQLAQELGLISGTPVFVGGGDTAVQALGRGFFKNGDLSVGISTGGNILSISKFPVVDKNLRIHCMNYIIPGYWFNMAATLSAGYSLQWLRDNFAPHLSFSDLADLASTIKPNHGLFFLPHLRGERSPYMDPNSKGVIIGLTSHHSLAHIARAVMEGVIFSLKLGYDIFKELDISCQTIILSGGGMRHPLSMEMVANIFNCPVKSSPLIDAAPLGAAMLAGIGSGIFSGYEEACNIASARLDTAILPDIDQVEQYSRIYEQFKSLYPLVKTFYQQGQS